MTVINTKWQYNKISTEYLESEYVITLNTISPAKIVSLGLQIYPNFELRNVIYSVPVMLPCVSEMCLVVVTFSLEPLNPGEVRCVPGKTELTTEQTSLPSPLL